MRHKSQLVTILIVTHLLIVKVVLCQVPNDSLLYFKLDAIGKLYFTNVDEALVKINKLLPVIENCDECNFEKVMAYRIKATIQGDTKNTDSCEYYFIKSAQLAKNNNFEFEEIKSLMNLASFYGEKEKLVKADSIFSILSKHSFYIKNSKEKIALNLNYSSHLKRKNDLNKSIEVLEEAMLLSVKLNYHERDLNIFHSLSGIYHTLNDSKKAIEYGKKTLKVMNPNDQRKYSVYNNLASSFVHMKQLDSAELYLNMILKGSPKETSKIFSYQTLGNIAYLRNKINLSNDYCDKCIDLANKYQSLSSVCMCSYFKARNLYKSGYYSKAKVDLEGVKDCIQKYFPTQEGPILKEITLANELALKGESDLEQKLIEFTTKKDSVRVGIMAEKTKEMEAKYGLEIKAAENIILSKQKQLDEATISKQWILIATLSLGLLSFLFFIFNYRRQAKERQKHNEELEAKNKSINALNREMNHRTKNHLALATALLSKSKVATKDKNVVSVLIENENRLRALSLVNEKLSSSVLDPQIELPNYLQELVEDLVFGYRHSSSMRASTNLKIDNISIDSEKCLRLGLITNELITNSFKHAVPINDELLIFLEIKIDGGNIIYQYNDNGVFNHQTVQETNTQGIGLIQDIVSQLNGECKITLHEGFKFKLSFANS